MRAHGRDTMMALAAMALASVAAFAVLGVADAGLSVPFDYTGDAHQIRMAVKIVIEHGWPYEEAALGAPGTSLQYDFPFGGDFVQLVPIWLLGRLNADPVWVTNVWQLLGFPLVALAAFAVLRALGVSGAVAVVVAVLYSLLPYHFGRGQAHLTLGLYVAGPLIVLLFMRVLAGTALWGPRRRTLGTLAACVVIGGSGSYYYGVFAVLLLGAAAGIALFLRRRRAALEAGGAVAAIVLVLALGYVPTAVHQAQAGGNPLVPARSAAESEEGGLKLAQLVLPIRGHRVEAARDLAERYVTTGVPQPAGEAQYSALGLVGAAGLAWLLVVALAGAAGGRRRLPGAAADDSHAAAGALILLLVGTIGGGSALVAYVLAPTLRSWNRISVVLAFFALLAVALLLDRGRAWLAARGAPRFVAPVALGVLLLAGIYDQTSAAFRPAYDTFAAQYRADQDLVATAEAALPAGAAVLQLPVAQYPEARAGNQDFYDPLRPYVISDRLRWSYGQMKGRPQDWLTTVSKLPRPAILKAGAAAGFQGVWFDAAGAPGTGAEDWRALLRATLRTEPVRSPDGRFEFWDMRPYAKRLGAAQLAAARDSAIHPLRREFGEGFGPERTEGAVQLFGFAEAGTIDIVNPAKAPRTATLSGFLRSAGPV
ncbi:MAG: hypothetical protein H0V29_07095, partial [Thermoleophilaceae bacterium]|nr:hypothetical protein [Thermoleophilaceae bacterium]